MNAEPVIEKSPMDCVVREILSDQEKCSEDSVVVPETMERGIR